MNTFAILFYRNSGSIPDDLIDLWEGALTDFVHCAIQISETEKIEAVYPRVVRSTINVDRVAARYDITEPVSPDVVAWIDSEVGQPYGVGDILDVIMQQPLFEQHFDCSALCTAFLKLINDVHVPSIADPHLVTPQLLARFLGVV